MAQWSQGMVWCSPERHGAMTGIMKVQIDWIPLSAGSVRPTQRKSLAVMQGSGGSQSFYAVNQLQILRRWMRMITIPIPNQSSVAKAFLEFDDAGRMKPCSYYAEPTQAINFMHLLFWAKNIERIGDHATHIAEDAYLIATGRQPEEIRRRADNSSTIIDTSGKPPA